MVALGVDTTKLFQSEHGIEGYLRDTNMETFHAYLRAYMDHGDCGRRNCSTYEARNDNVLTLFQRVYRCWVTDGQGKNHRFICGACGAARVDLMLHACVRCPCGRKLLPGTWKIHLAGTICLHLSDDSCRVLTFEC